MKKGKKLRIFIDGAARGNPGQGACAAVFFDAAGTILCEEGKYLGRCTDKFAEYNGLRLALAAAARLGGQELEIFSDSGLLVKQFSGACGIKGSGLAALMPGISEPCERFRKISFSQVPGGKNREAQRLVSRILDNAGHASPALDESLAAENAAGVKKTPRKTLA